MSSLLLVSLCGCGSDRSASGTTGTEAGNALAATFSLPDGRPAARATVVVRPSNAVDSSSRADWIRATADERGTVSLRFGDGDWTLEARSGSYALAASIHGGHDVEVRDTLTPMRTFAGNVLGAPSGSKLSLPGLGVSVALGSDGEFRFDSVPTQDLPLLLGGLSGWNAPAKSATVVLSASQANSVLADVVRLDVEGEGVPRLRILPDSLFTDSDMVLVDSTGNLMALRIGGGNAGLRRIWTRIPRGTRTAYLGRRVAGPKGSDSVFRTDDGIRLAVVPDLDSTLRDLSSGTARFRLFGTRANDPTFGQILSADLGAQLGAIDSGLPASGPFTVAFRAQLGSQSIESIWLLDWTDPATGSGVRVGVGGGRLILRSNGRDTSVAWDPGSSWFGAEISWDGQTLRLVADGITRIQQSPGASTMLDRSGWNRRNNGIGGSLRVAQVVVADRAVTPGLLSLPPIAQTASKLH